VGRRNFPTDELRNQYGKSEGTTCEAELAEDFTKIRQWGRCHRWIKGGGGSSTGVSEPEFDRLWWEKGGKDAVSVVIVLKRVSAFLGVERKRKKLITGG